MTRDRSEAAAHARANRVFEVGARYATEHDTLDLASDVTRLVRQVRRDGNLIDEIRSLVMNTDGDFLDGADFDGLAGEVQRVLHEHGALEVGVI